MKTLARIVLGTLGMAVGAYAAQAATVIYDFTGYTSIGGVTHAFTGVYEYESGRPSDTVYFNGITQGFRSSYYNSIRGLSITLDNGESVVCGAGGYIDVNNIQQSEPGAGIPAGLTAQAWAGTSSGTINGRFIHYMYLAFLPISPNFNWDPLDNYFDDNAENILNNNPALLPRNIDPTLTGTSLEPSMARLANSLFLGTVHNAPNGVTTTVNTVNSFERRVPTPGAVTSLGLVGLVALRRRR